MDDMFALFQLRLPIVNVIDLKTKLVKVVESQGKGQRNAKDDRSRKLLTMQNMMRLAFVHGAVNVVEMKNDVIVKHLTASGITRGPRKSAG